MADVYLCEGISFRIHSDTKVCGKEFDGAAPG